MMRLRDPATGRIPKDARALELAYAATLPMRGARGAFYRAAGIADFGWSPRGPYNVGGRTRALALDISGEDTILAGGVSGGMWRSSDGGRSWSRTTRPDQLPSVTCLVQDRRPGRTHIWYCGTGEAIGNSPSKGGAYYYGDGVFRSTDNGRSWEQTPGTKSPLINELDRYTDLIYNIAIDPSNTEQTEIYCATYGSVRRSVDDGNTFEPVLFGTSLSYFSDVAVTSSGVVYATMSGDGDKGGIWRSANGVDYVRIAPPAWPGNSRRTVIGVAPSNENIVYFLAETPGTGSLGRNFRGDSSWQSLWRYTWLSGDGTGEGGRWEDLSANLPKLGGSFGDFYSQTGYDLHVTVRPDDENIVFVGGTNIYRSTDGFTTAGAMKWIGGYRNVQIDSMVVQDYSYPGHHPDQHGVVFSRRDPKVAFTASDGGVHRTDDVMADSVTWTSLNNGYATSQFYTIAIDPATPGSDFIIGGMQDNGTWGAAGNGLTPWREYGSGDGSFCAVRGGGGELVVSKQEGKTYRVILNEAGIMSAFTRIDPEGGAGYMFINPFATDPLDDKIVYLCGGRTLWRNDDITTIPLDSRLPAVSGWKKLEATTTPRASSELSAVAVSTANPAHRVYYGTSDGNIYRIDNAHQGEPVSANVTPLTFPRNGYINSIAVDPRDGNRAVAVFSNYGIPSLFLTTNAGETWTQIGGNLEPSGKLGPSCRWFSFLHRPGGTIYFVGTSVGLYSTTKLEGTATTWALEGPTQIGNVVVDMITTRESDGYVVVGTHGNGVFSTQVISLGAERPDPRRDLAFEEFRPNPARESTTMTFVIPPSAVGARAVMTLYDMRGRPLRTPIDEPLTEGRHIREIDLRGLPSGTYQARLAVAGLVEERRVTVVR